MCSVVSANKAATHVEPDVNLCSNNHFTSTSSIVANANLKKFLKNLKNIGFTFVFIIITSLLPESFLFETLLDWLYTKTNVFSNIPTIQTKQNQFRVVILYFFLQHVDHRDHHKHQIKQLWHTMLPMLLASYSVVVVWFVATPLNLKKLKKLKSKKKN